MLSKAPSIVAPKLLCFGVASCMINHIEGKFRLKCGAFVKMGRPEYDFSPDTAQLLLPLCGLVLSMVSEKGMESSNIQSSGASGI